MVPRHPIFLFFVPFVSCLHITKLKAHEHDVPEVHPAIDHNDHHDHHMSHHSMPYLMHSNFPTMVKEGEVLLKCEVVKWPYQQDPEDYYKKTLCLCSNLTGNLTKKGLKTTECEKLASSGDFVQMQCAANYSKPQGPLIAECLSGEWKPFETTCLKMCSCEDLRKNLSDSLAATCDGNVGSGDFVDLECSQGYVNLTGDSAAECMEGLWLMKDTYCNATDEVPTEEGRMRDCTYKIAPTSDFVQAYYHGRFVSHNSAIPHLGTITLKCAHVLYLKFVGKKRMQCIDGKFDGPTPQCQKLTPNSPQSAPPLSLITDPNSIYLVDELGVVVIRRGTAITINCWYSQTKPDINIESTVQFKSQKEIASPYFSGWATATEFDPISDVTTLNYSCGVPGKTPKEDFTQYLEIKISDTCQIDNDLELWVDPTNKRDVYTEGDRVNLICGGRVSRGFPYMTCTQGRKWDFAPKVDCPKE